MDEYLKKLFIDEAKPALERHSGSGGGTNVTIVVENDKLVINNTSSSVTDNGTLKM